MIGTMPISMKHARLTNDLLQKEVADLLKVDRKTYMRWEKDATNMPISKAKDFSIIVGKSLDDIFFNYDSTLSVI